MECGACGLGYWLLGHPGGLGEGPGSSDQGADEEAENVSEGRESGSSCGRAG